MAQYAFGARISICQTRRNGEKWGESGCRKSPTFEASRKNFYAVPAQVKNNLFFPIISVIYASSNFGRDDRIPDRLNLIITEAKKPQKSVVS
jgi:hypothetical protein